MLVSFATQTIDVLRGVETTDHGNRVLDFNAPARHQVGGCVVVPVDGTENLNHRDATYAEYRVLAPPAADITARDRIEYAGTEYKIIGPVRPIPSPTGGLDHKALLIGNWEG